MSIVRTLIVPTIAAASLAATAQAAPAGAAHPLAQAHAVSQADQAKHSACEKVWAVQKVRHGTHQAFIAACVAKG